MGHSRKHPYHPHGGNRKLTSLPPSDVLIHLLLSETWGEYGSFLERGGEYGSFLEQPNAISCTLGDLQSFKGNKMS